jgi:polyphosphate glucokinase
MRTLFFALTVTLTGLSSVPASAGGGKTTLGIDIGGTGVKFGLIRNGKMIGERQKIATPKGATPAAIIKLIQTQSKKMGSFDQVAVGFPGVTRRGVIETAPNINPEAWPGEDLRGALESKIGKPVRVANDAAVAALGLATESKGKRVFVMTLGTGVGSSLLNDGSVTPLEFGHHPFEKGKSYEERLSNAQLEAVGTKKWNKRLGRALETIESTFKPDLILLGGGNSKKVKGKLLSDKVKIVGNDPGLLGAPRLFDAKNGSL